MAKNSEVYKTAQEREEAFRMWCDNTIRDAILNDDNDDCQEPWSIYDSWLDMDSEDD